MAAKIDAVQLAGLLSYIAKAADVDTADSIAAHIAALEQERDAANARVEMEIQQTKAVADALSDAASEMSALRRERDAAVADDAAVRLKLSQAADGYSSRDFWDSVDALRGTAHPGAALLEEHRKALEAARQALDSQQAEAHTLRRAFLHERHRADAAGAPPEHAYNAKWAESLLADERKALVRARNEGLEKVAAVASADAERARRAIAKLNLTTDMGQRRHILLAQRRDLMDALVRDIRAMKDPE